jgi:hypothetical protein
VTEAEWLACTDPKPMESFLIGRVSQRKWQLLACACCRRVWHLFVDERSRQGIEAVEQFADGQINRKGLRQAGSAAYQAWWDVEPRDDHEDHPRSDPHTRRACFHAANAVVRLTGTGDGCWADGFDTAASEVRRAVWFAPAEDQRTAEADEHKAQCDLIRELIRNPFRRVTVPTACQTPQVVGLAQAAYDERQLPSGHLDPARLAVLADALEDAGCTDPDLLAHLRGPGPHVRGCWALSLVLGPH